MPNCNKCGLPIIFEKMASGKFCPKNKNGSDHWDDCRTEILKDPARRKAQLKADAAMMKPATTYATNYPLYSGAL